MTEELDRIDNLAEALNKARAENERLRAHAKSMVDALNADIDAKAAEIEALRALLREAFLYGDQIASIETWWREARRALEPKP